jgi:hypothetical protein
MCCLSLVSFIIVFQDSYEECPGQSSSLASPSSSPTTKHVEDLESAISLPERPSPVSVLEPLFTEDEISPSKTISQPGTDSYQEI